MGSRVRRVSWLGLTACALLVIQQQSVVAKDGAQVLAPKGGAMVFGREDLFGKVLTAGQPVVLVRADLPGSAWWVQDPAEVTGPQTFKVVARFGNDQTPDGTKFRVVVVLPRTPAEAAQLQVGQSLESLPKGLPMSSEMQYVLQREREAAAKANVTLELSTNGTVARLEKVRGRVLAKGVPVVLIRADLSNELWWVQEPAEVDKDGHFTCHVRFGNEKTPPGTRFRMVVLLSGSEQDARKFRTGAALRGLPAEIPRSAEITVVVGGGKKPVAAGNRAH